MSFAIYIHLPFCRGKCPYCSFVSAPDAEHIIPSYFNALETRLTFSSLVPYPNPSPYNFIPTIKIPIPTRIYPADETRKTGAGLYYNEILLKVRDLGFGFVVI